MKRGLFIALEGIDGSGKSIQVDSLKKKIQKTNHACYKTEEPTQGPVGALIRQCLCGRLTIDENTLAAMFAADRLDHLYNHVNGLRDKLIKGTSVICDRYLLSSYAYQSVRAPLEWIEDINRIAEDTVKVDRHIFLDVSPETAVKRIAANRQSRDLFEKKDRLTAVRENYLNIIKLLKEEHQADIVIIDGEQPVEKVTEDIWNSVSDLFDPQNKE